MSDLIIHHVDRQTAERIKELARQRQWAINDVALNALRQGLGLSAAGQIFAGTPLEGDELILGGHWDANEKAVFQEAVQALSATRARGWSAARLRG